MTHRFSAPAAILAAALLGAAVMPASAQAPPEFQAGIRNCQRVLPAARRFIGQPERAVRQRVRAPRGVIVRYCLMCTRDYRPNRLTFGLDQAQVVRSASCG
jgi:hypothetical protein